MLSPKSLDASNKDLSIFSKETKIGNIAKGAQPCTSASTTAFELYNKKVKGSVITPSHSKKSLKHRYTLILPSTKTSLTDNLSKMVWL